MYHGDCREVLKRIPDGTIDVVIADPPFYLDVPEGETVIDHYIAKNGMKPRFAKNGTSSRARTITSSSATDCFSS